MPSRKKIQNKKSQEQVQFKKLRLNQIIFGSITILGFIILAWCGYTKGNPFPYASFIGMFLIFIGMVIFMRTDRSPKPKDPPTGGDIGGNFGD